MSQSLCGYLSADVDMWQVMGIDVLSGCKGAWPTTCAHVWAFFRAAASTHFELLFAVCFTDTCVGFFPCRSKYPF